ncbi:hypothetical protein MITS9509_03462 [Synechococcus sp. MIT S9509]|nr:hypothetical protein MITS9509_03462 [Synechococcus sp. MIT S9509]
MICTQVIPFQHRNLKRLPAVELPGQRKAVLGDVFASSPSLMKSVILKNKVIDIGKLPSFEGNF